MSELLPLFLNLTGRAVVLVGGGRVASGKLRHLLAAGANVTVVAPEIRDEIVTEGARATVSTEGARAYHPSASSGCPEPVEGQASGSRGSVSIRGRVFEPADLDGAWLVVAAATPQVNREVAAAAEARHIFVNAVDDPANASAYLSGVVRRDGVTLAISTSGDAPALAALLREALDAVLPRDLASWVRRARTERAVWRRSGVPIEARKPLLLRALNALYDEQATAVAPSAASAVEHGARVPWLNAPEDSWL
jgi:uroporphyrin-III C-methyltransferase/precorrin-2 dehydrogenase/sirohydrochlorin ferrochelatase